jgi:hypothetical protein
VRQSLITSSIGRKPPAEAGGHETAMHLAVSGGISQALQRCLGCRPFARPVATVMLRRVGTSVYHVFHLVGVCLSSAVAGEQASGLQSSIAFVLEPPAVCGQQVGAVS